MRPLVSVIIPVFGVEKTIERCARSLFEQTLDGIEYIFVNDCSPDNSMDILQRLMAEYPDRDVKIINQPKNMGPAATMNSGNNAATGEYVTRCDSDDEVRPEMYEEMYHAAKAGNYDVVLCDFLQRYEGGAESYMGQYAHNSDELMRGLLTNKLSTSQWSKLVRRNMITDNNFIFPSHNMCEDMVYSIQYAYYAQSVTCLHKPYYLYYRYSGAYSARYDRENRLRLFQELKNNVDVVFNFLDSKGLSKQYKEEIIYQKYKVKNFLNFSRDEDIRRMWKETYSEINHKIIFSKILPFSEKMIYLMDYFGVHHIYRKFKKFIHN